MFSALWIRLTALSQDAVQAVELAEEPSVGDDASVVLHGFDGLHQRQVLSDHQVRQHQSGRAAHSHCAVDQHLTSIDEGFVDELSSRIEVDAHVEGGGIMSLDAVISDVHPSVILGTASPLALGTVEDVCNLEFGQLSSV